MCRGGPELTAAEEVEVKSVRYVGGPLEGVTRELPDDQIPWAGPGGPSASRETSPQPWSPGEKALDALADLATAMEVAGSLKAQERFGG